jgi:hypothetical protein
LAGQLQQQLLHYFLLRVDSTGRILWGRAPAAAAGPWLLLLLWAYSLLLLLLLLEGP